MTGREPNVSDADAARRSAAVMWEGDAASRALGMVVEHVGPGEARVRMEVRADMVNGWELCHGGLIATLADSAMALASNSRGTVNVASGFQVELLEAVRLGDVLVAEGRQISARGRSSVYDVTVRRGATVIAEFRGRCRSLNRPIVGDGD